MKNDKARLEELLENAMSKCGIDRVETSLNSLIANSMTDSLTIISSDGNHKIPNEYLRGEVYVASKGNLDFSSAEIIEVQFSDILRRTRLKLLERSWKRIFLIPTGHPTLAAQLKMIVYRTTRISTVDIFYYSGNYFELDIDLRKLDLGQ